MDVEITQKEHQDLTLKLFFEFVEEDLAKFIKRVKAIPIDVCKVENR